MTSGPAHGGGLLASKRLLGAVHFKTDAALAKMVREKRCYSQITRWTLLIRTGTEKVWGRLRRVSLAK